MDQLMHYQLNEQDGLKHFLLHGHLVNKDFIFTCGVLSSEILSYKTLYYLNLTY
jgi:hypothetical protein